MSASLLISSQPVPRAELVKSFPTPRLLRAFESAQTDIMATGNFAQAIQTAGIVTVSATDALNGERVLTGGVGIGLADGGPNSTVTLNLTDTGVAPGGYGGPILLASLTVDAEGRVTAASDSPLTGTDPIVVDPITGFIGLAPSGITAGTYGDVRKYLALTIDAKGRVTTAVETPATYEFNCSAENPIASNKVILRLSARLAMTVPANLAGWVVNVDTPPAAAFVMPVYRRAVGAGAYTQFGTISISTAGVATMTTTGGASQAFGIGDVLAINAPATADATIAGLSISGFGVFSPIPSVTSGLVITYTPPATRPLRDLAGNLIPAIGV